ncbi:hypothetical protein M885DRAFT_535088 [Pelagophyceae sp. CCMP2097]|nr:hypothetical protein M885DRAFT_535088 [Pelagophyceae sp. CCMP2097]
MASQLTDEFGAILRDMVGTKESIKGAKDWMLARTAHAQLLAVALRKHVVSARGDFTRVLFAVYLLNDVFFNTAKDETYRYACFDQLGAMLHAACASATDDDQRAKVLRVVDLWGAKAVYAAPQIAALKQLAAGAQPPRPPSPNGALQQQQQQQPTPAPVAAPAPNSAAFAAAAGVAAIRNLQQAQALAAAKGAAAAAAPAAAAAAPRCDLATMPVGVMAGLVKIALTAGHEPWSPLDVSSMPTLMPAAIEPGRLEARVKEFYRVIEADRARREERRREDRGALGAKRMREAGILDDERPAIRMPDDGGQSAATGMHERARPRYAGGEAARARAAAEADLEAAQARPDRAIGDENLGKQMLRGMGWEEGRGLGTEGRGRAEPITDGGQLDKVGIGSRTNPNDPSQPADAYAAYRNTRSDQHGAKQRRGWN